MQTSQAVVWVCATSQTLKILHSVSLSKNTLCYIAKLKSMASGPDKTPTHTQTQPERLRETCVP